MRDNDKTLFLRWFGNIFQVAVYELFDDFVVLTDKISI